MASTKATGDIGEQLAAEYLESAGYRVVERNAEYAGAEVDLIAEAYLDEDGNVVKHKEEGALSKLIGKLLKKGKGAQAPNEKVESGAERTVIFCEVKRRLTAEYGSGAEAVTPYKVGRYVKAAKIYLAAKGLSGAQVRFDIIEVGEDDVHHIKGAFDTGDAKYMPLRKM